MMALTQGIVLCNQVSKYGSEKIVLLFIIEFVVYMESDNRPRRGHEKSRELRGPELEAIIKLPTFQKLTRPQCPFHQEP
jgi:hypothetical protein